MSLLTNLIESAQALLDAYGGDTPDWLRAEATALEKAIGEMRDAAATPEERAAAQDEHGSDDVEIDDDALASRTDEGTWVQGWVYVAMSDDEPEDEEDDA